MPSTMLFAQIACWLLPPCVALSIMAAGPARADVHRFELDAPAAREVYLAGEMTNWDQGKLPMQRSADGKWRLNVDLAPGQWLYKFVVDGLWIADPGPADRDADGAGGEHSFVFIGNGDWQDDPQNPEGRVEALQVTSSALGQAVKVNIYWPPGFVRGQRYPVLWLLHGWGMDADQWARTGQVNRYLDKLIARGTIRPFVVVMPSVPGNRQTPPYAAPGERFLTQELPAWLAGQHGLRVDRQRSAVAGMSWGGLGAFHLGLKHPRLYGLSFALSAAFPDEFIASLPKAGPLPMHTWLLCGSDDKQVTANRKLAAALRARQAAFTYREDPGGHTWQYWSHRTSEMLTAVDAFFQNRQR
jgi:enterochelin esterase-like enzyme